MPSANPIIVHIETPAGKPMGNNECDRSWLDSQKIQPADFKVVPTARGQQRSHLAVTLFLRVMMALLAVCLLAAPMLVLTD